MTATATSLRETATRHATAIVEGRGWRDDGTRDLDDVSNEEWGFWVNFATPAERQLLAEHGESAVRGAIDSAIADLG